MPNPSTGPTASSRRPLHLGATFVAALLLAAFLLASAPGCSRGTQVSGENRELIVSLATAVSTREAKWLDENVAKIEERRAEGKCSDAEYAAFREIIDKARAGDWDAAQESAYALRDAQEPNAEDLKNLAERKVSHEPKLLNAKGKPIKKS